MPQTLRMLQADADKIELRDRTLVVILLFCSFRPRVLIGGSFLEAAVLSCMGESAEMRLSPRIQSATFMS